MCVCVCVCVDRSLDPSTSHEAPTKDLVDYISYRVNVAPVLRDNVTLAGAKYQELGASAQVARFAHHLSGLARANFLHAKLSLDLIEQGHLVTKSASYKVRPLSFTAFISYSHQTPTTTASFASTLHLTQPNPT